jgi:hypothetical protein
MNHRPGATVPETAIYWCTVCKLPEKLVEGQPFPECRNMCGRGLWELVEREKE